MRQRAPRYDLPKAAPGRLRLVQQFVNTTDHEHTRELLATPAALEGWLAGEGFVVRSVGPATLRRAHAVRDGLRELVVTGTAGEALEAAADRARLTLDLEAGELRPRASGVDGALGTMLAAVYDAAARRKLGAVQGVPELRLGVLGRVAQSLGGLVLDAALRQPPQGEAAPRQGHSSVFSLAARSRIS